MPVRTVRVVEDSIDDKPLPEGRSDSDNQLIHSLRSPSSARIYGRTD